MLPFGYASPEQVCATTFTVGSSSLVKEAPKITVSPAEPRETVTQPSPKRDSTPQPPRVTPFGEQPVFTVERPEQRSIQDKAMAKAIQQVDCRSMQLRRTRKAEEKEQAMTALAKETG